MSNEIYELEIKYLEHKPWCPLSLGSAAKEGSVATVMYGPRLRFKWDVPANVCLCRPGARWERSDLNDVVVDTERNIEIICRKTPDKHKPPRVDMFPDRQALASYFRIISYGPDN